MTIYRTSTGRLAVRAAARRALDDWTVAHERTTYLSELGPTHVVSAGDGPPLVLLAGTNFCTATWLDLVGRLVADFRVHAVDLPGQPGLSADERPRSPRAYGRWLARLLPTLTPEPSTVVGHSLGAHVALTGVAAGARVRALALLDPAGPMRLSVTPTVLRPTFPWLRRPDEGTSTALLRMMMAPGATPDAATVAWMSLVGRHVRTSLAPRPLSGADLARAAAAPVLVASGVEDAFVPPARLRRAVARRLPTAAFHVVDRAGHLLPHERPDEVVRLLRTIPAPAGA